jgi:hypothetical protein
MLRGAGKACGVFSAMHSLYGSTKNNTLTVERGAASSVGTSSSTPSSTSRLVPHPVKKTTMRAASNMMC